MLSRKNQVPDETISENVVLQLSNRGLRSPCHISVRTAKGEVTLSGSVQYPHQKQSAMHAARGVGGVRRVVDRMVVKAAPIRS